MQEAEKSKKAHRFAAGSVQEGFTLRAIGDMSFREIGRRFGKSENWACVTYHRARKNAPRKDGKHPARALTKELSRADFMRSRTAERGKMSIKNECDST